MPDRTKPRSDRYQYLLVESVCDCNNVMKDTLMFSEFQRSEADEQKILELRDRLLARVLEVVDLIATKNQNTVLRLLLAGNTQVEAAKILGRNQSSITKSIRGNTDYASGKRQYGGLMKKLKKACSLDSVCRDLLNQILVLSGGDEPEPKKELTTPPPKPRVPRIPKPIIYAEPPFQCSIDGCQRLKNSRGLCKMHYDRFKKHGSPHIKLKTGRKRKP